MAPWLKSTTQLLRLFLPEQNNRWRMTREGQTWETSPVRLHFTYIIEGGREYHIDLYLLFLTVLDSRDTNSQVLSTVTKLLSSDNNRLVKLADLEAGSGTRSGTDVVMLRKLTWREL